MDITREMLDDKSKELQGIELTWIYNFYTDVLKLKPVVGSDSIIFHDLDISFPVTYKFSNSGIYYRMERKPDKALFSYPLNRSGKTIIYRKYLAMQMYHCLKLILSYREKYGISDEIRNDAVHLYNFFKKKSHFNPGTDMYYGIRFIAYNRTRYLEYPSHENLSVYEKVCLGIDSCVNNSNIPINVDISGEDRVEKARQSLEDEICNLTQRMQSNTQNHDISIDGVDLHIAVETIEKSQKFKAVILMGDDIIKEYPVQNNKDAAKRLALQDAAKLKVVITEVDKS